MTKTFQVNNEQAQLLLLTLNHSREQIIKDILTFERTPFSKEIVKDLKLRYARVAALIEAALSQGLVEPDLVNTYRYRIEIDRGIALL